MFIFSFGQILLCESDTAIHGSWLFFSFIQRKVKDKANPRDATPEKQPAETLEVSGTWRTRAYGV